ncbi:MAG: elongation factor G [Oscillospiraceae bacterium]|nr:elongation factor G [Oscillospiraceae bacterium]
MKTFQSNNIRNIAVAGHANRGKTTLCEAMLYTAGASSRFGSVDEGTTVMDYDPEERKRHVSLKSSVASLEWNDVKINLIDTPGLFDFAGGLSEAVRAAGCMLIVTDAEKAKYDVGAEKAFSAAETRGLSKIFVINKTDAENANFGNVFDALKEVHGNKLCPVVVPYIEDSKIRCLVNFSQNKAWKYEDGKCVQVEMPQSDRLDEYRDMFNEAVATTDDALMEKYFDGEPFTEVEALTGLLAGVTAGDIYPVYSCAAEKLYGIDLLLNGLVNLGPSATSKTGETATDQNGEEKQLSCDPNGPLAAICFKTVADPFVGKMSFFKVISGQITPETPAYNARTGKTERIGKLAIPHGEKLEDTKVITAGDIGVITKLAGFQTGDTLCSSKQVLTLKGLEFPVPTYTVAVSAVKKGDEEKIATGLNRLKEQDPSIEFHTDRETKEMLLSGLGEQHIDVIISELKSKFGVDVELSKPKVAYREAIRKTVKVQGKYKKQSGGHGQYGDVWIRFEPTEGDDLVFEEEVFGGSVPKNYFPAVEKGLRDAVKHGVLAGYPMVGVKAVLYDGSYHPVDSSEMAFKTAASLAYKQGIPQAGPVLLEPIDSVEVVVPDSDVGDIMGDITKRRGRVLGMEPIEDRKGYQTLTAEVPEAELSDFPTTLRQTTRGRGSFTKAFARYEEAPSNVAQKVIEAASAQ